MLNTRSALNITLMLVVAALGAIIYFKPGVEAPEVSVPLTALQPDQIRRIDITRQDMQAVTLVKEQRGWHIQSPINIAANNMRIETLLRLAQAPSHARFAIDGLDLAAYEIDQPLMVIRLDDVELAFGGNESLNNRRYVRIGSVAHLIADSFYYQAQADLSGFVALDLLPADARLQKIVLPGLTIHNDEGGQWRDATPDKGLSADEINSLAAAWQRAQAIRVSRYTAQDVVAGKIAVFLKQEPQRLDFDILKSDSEMILGRKDIGMRYHLTEEQAGQLRLPVEHISRHAGDSTAAIID